MNDPKPSITVSVDPTNPGQFFACCGLLELADRLWPGATGWFAENQREFQIACAGTLGGIGERLHSAKIQGALTPTLQQERSALEQKKRDLRKRREALSPNEEKRRKELGTMYREGNLLLPSPFDLLLDWWQSDDEGTPKTWAGSQAVIRIALAAQYGCARLLNGKAPLSEYVVMRPPGDDDDAESGDPEIDDKVEPFYFDAQRGASALARDIGFMPDAIEIETKAAPVVEFLALIGLQRCRPLPTAKPRVFDYFTWTWRVYLAVLPVAVTGRMGDPCATRYRFRNAFRTGQEKHKAFMPAVPNILGDRS